MAKYGEVKLMEQKGAQSYVYIYMWYIYIYVYDVYIYDVYIYIWCIYLYIYAIYIYEHILYMGLSHNFWCIMVNCSFFCSWYSTRCYSSGVKHSPCFGEKKMLDILTTKFSRLSPDLLRLKKRFLLATGPNFCWLNPDWLNPKFLLKSPFLLRIHRSHLWHERKKTFWWLVILW